MLQCWKRLLSLVSEPHSSKAILLGVAGNGQALPLGWRALWLIVWKFIIISFTQIGVGEATDLNEEAVWELALRRLAVRVHAAAYSYRLRLGAAEAKGRKPPTPVSTNKLLEPLASLNEQGDLTWHPTIADKLKSLGVEGPKPKPRPKEAAKKPALASIIFVEQSSPEKCSEEPSSTPPLIGEEDRYAWHITRHITAERKGNRVTLYSTFSLITGVELVLAPSGHPLPTDTFTCFTNPDKEETIKQLCRAMRKATPENLVYQSRPQLLVFSAEHGRGAAEAYARRLWQAGLSTRSAVTEATLPCSNAYLSKLVSRALRRYNALHLDIYQLRGPKEKM